MNNHCNRRSSGCFISLLLLFSFTSQSCESEIEMSLGINESPYHHSLEWGNVPIINSFGSYFTSIDDYSFNYTSTTEEVYTQFDKLVSRYPDVAFSYVIGYASDGQAIYCYRVGAINNTRAPRIIIVCAQHGFEKSSSYGTFLFVRELLMNNGPLFDYLKKTVDFVIVPVANPYGFDTCLYKNKNKVNLNRNWPVINWTPMADDINSSNYPGLEPLNQPETIAIDNIIAENHDSSLIIDFHTYGASNVTSLEELNWIGIPYLEDVRDEYYNGIFDVANTHLSRTASFFPAKYGKNRERIREAAYIGTVSSCSFYRTRGTLNNYGAQKKIISVTFEGFNGFPDDKERFTPEVAEANAELLACFIYSFCEHYSHL